MPSKHKKITALIINIVLLVTSGLACGLFYGAYFIIVPGVFFGISISAALFLTTTNNKLAGLFMLLSPAIYTGSVFISAFIFGMLFNREATNLFIHTFNLSPPESGALGIGLVGSVLLALVCQFFGLRTINAVLIALLGTALSVLFFHITDGYNNPYINRAYPFVIWQVVVGCLILYGLKDQTTVVNDNM